MDSVDDEISPHVDIYTWLVVVLLDHVLRDFHVRLEIKQLKMIFFLNRIHFYREAFQCAYLIVLIYFYTNSIDHWFV